ncbi:hypothetical protein [Fibrella arboris]|uniref:hypothetical protein n=1 Tax=Fibrella arboris TaxID=3242486 RepID=UPI003521E5B7
MNEPDRHKTRFFGMSVTDNKFRLWFKRLGWAGFFFFLIKGLLWLLIPYLMAKGFWSK